MTQFEIWALAEAALASIRHSDVPAMWVDPADVVRSVTARMVTAGVIVAADDAAEAVSLVKDWILHGSG